MGIVKPNAYTAAVKVRQTLQIC